MVKKKEIGIVIIVTFFILVGIQLATIYYTNTHKWVTLSITGSVDADVCEAYAYHHDYLQGDTFSLYTTQVTVEDVAYDGTVVLSFSPEVDSYDGETVSRISLKCSEGIDFTERCEPGEYANYSITVASYRYE